MVFLIFKAQYDNAQSETGKSLLCALKAVTRGTVYPGKAHSHGRSEMRQRRRGSCCAASYIQISAANIAEASSCAEAVRSVYANGLISTLKSMTSDVWRLNEICGII